MVTRVVYNNKAFKIIDKYGYKFSSNEVTFNDITIDFTDCSISDIPFKYQEIKIMQADTEENILNGNILFTGYLDTINLSDMKMRKEFREMTLTLLSPLKMATKRSTTLIGTYELKEAIKRVLQPLLDDGYIIKELNVQDSQITTNYVLQTVEYEMNDICFKRNVFWYINEKKEIFVNSLEYLFGLPVEKEISYKLKQEGLLMIQPEIENNDYANVINFKNVRLIYSQIEDTENKYPIVSSKNIKKGDSINFDNPIIVDENYLRNYLTNENTDRSNGYNLLLEIQLASGTLKQYSIMINEDKYTISEGITFSNDSGDEGEIVLQRDSFFSNLITGFKWNYDSDATITKITSDTALRYTVMRFMYSAEINKLKGVISQSGQIEKTIDYNEKWTTLSQLISYARSLMVQNSNVINQVTLQYDKDPKLKIGGIVEIDEPSFYIQGKFAVKDISYTFCSELEQNWQITLKSTDLISTYIDMFRPAEQETPTSTIENVILSEFIEENIKETHNIELDNTKYTLNFNI